MNSATIEESIHKIFPSIKRLESNASIIRCERRPNGVLMSVFYFDVSNLGFDDEFDLEAFQERYIADDFYRNRGLIQWNYYFVFVVDDSRIPELKRSGRIAAIESNRSYARKFVVAENDLSQFLKSAVSVVAAPVQDGDDFTLRWKARLDQSGLSEIYSGTARSQLLRKYRSGQFDPVATTATSDDARSDFKLSRLKSLTIEKYRGRIKPATYDLCQVNLLHGPNGAGKTSFLEAIELCICGQTSQNGHEPSGASLSLVLDGGQREKFPRTANGSDDAFYRARDRLLYGRAYTRGNLLASAFARYNFFATDAAFRLAHQDTAEEISKALTNFIVGPDTATLDERLKRISEEVGREVNGLTTAVDRMEAEIQAKDAEIERLSKTFSEPGQENLLVQDVLTKLPVASEQRAKILGAGDLRAFLASVQPVVESVVEKIDWIRPLSVDSITRDRNALTELRRSSERITGQIEALKQSKQAAESNAIRRQEIIRSLQRLQSYLSIALPSDIRGLSSRIGALEASARVSAALGSSVETYRNLEPQFPNMTLGTVIADLERRELDASKILKDIGAKIETASSTATKLRVHILALREHGLGYLALGGNPSLCPLCNAMHAPAELQRIVESIEADLVNSPDISRLLAEKKKIETERTESIEMLSRLRNQTGVCNAAFEGRTDLQPSLMTLGAISAELEKMDEGQVALKGETDRLRKIRETLESSGLSESDFIKTLASLPPDLGADDLLSTERVEAKATEILHEVASANQSAAKLKEQIDALETQRDAQLRSNMSGPQEIAYIVKLLPDRISKLETAAQSLDSLDKSLDLQTGNDLFKLENLLKIELKRVDEFLLLGIRARESSEALSKAKSEAERLRKDLPAKRDEANNLKKVLDVVSDILIRDSVEINLKTFLQSYKKTITEIFASIHAPREFSSIVIGDGGVEEILLERQGGERVNLKQISTGQRSALALSIFLALQSSVRSRADLILIDDPVAHVDDLNSLSFLDHLRNLALDGAQIVFATADQKLARLFEMKFAFLAEIGAYQQLQFDVDGTIMKKELPAPKERRLH